MHAFGRAIQYFRRRRVLLTLVTFVCVHITPVHSEASAYRGPTLPTTRFFSEILPEPTFVSSQQITQQSTQPSKDRKRVSTTVKVIEQEPAAVRWILAQVDADKDANLKEHFPDEADRVVDAIFIRKLLLGGYNEEITVHPYGIHISNAKIVGTLNLMNQYINYETSLSDCVFENEVFLYGANFKGSLRLERTTFISHADFGYAVLPRELSLKDSVFNGPASFYRINVAGNLSADRTHFNDVKEGVTFEGMKVGGYAFFREGRFKGPARFYGAHVTDNFEADDAVFSATTNPTNFENTRIDADALFRKTIFEGPVRFQSMIVGGSFETGTNLGGAYFNGAADFTNVTADAVGFPQTFFSGSIDLRGLKYQRMSSGVADNLLFMLNRSDYHSSAYTELEQYCLRIGDLEKADEVYLQKRRRERSQLAIGPWLGSVMLDWLVGYGRRPWRTLFWSALVVAGAAVLIFRKSQMQARNQEDEAKHYSAFIYSLDLLLPIIDLQSASIWTPKPDSRLARRYLPIHVITGWILATILAATLTGLLK